MCPETLEKLSLGKGNPTRKNPNESTYFLNQQAFHSGDTQNSRETISIPEENGLLNLHVTPGPHFKNTFICKLIAFILLVSAFIFPLGYFNRELHSPYFLKVKAILLL